jgi:hypothetical protein
MKELEKQTPDKETAQHAHKHEFVYVALVAHQKGHTMFEWNTITNTVQEAKYADVAFDVERGAYVKKLIMNKGCEYREFLNLKNALKKFKK